MSTFESKVSPKSDRLPDTIVSDLRRELPGLVRMTDQRLKLLTDEIRSGLRDGIKGETPQADSVPVLKPSLLEVLNRENVCAAYDGSISIRTLAAATAHIAARLIGEATELAPLLSYIRSGDLSFVRLIGPTDREDKIDHWDFANGVHVFELDSFVVAAATRRSITHAKVGVGCVEVNGVQELLIALDWGAEDPRMFMSGPIQDRGLRASDPRHFIWAGDIVIDATGCLVSNLLPVTKSARESGRFDSTKISAVVGEHVGKVLKWYKDNFASGHLDPERYELDLPLVHEQEAVLRKFLRYVSAQNGEQYSSHFLNALNLDVEKCDPRAIFSPGVIEPYSVPLQNFFKVHAVCVGTGTHWIDSEADVSLGPDEACFVYSYGTGGPMSNTLFTDRARFKINHTGILVLAEHSSSRVL